MAEIAANKEIEIERIKLEEKRMERFEESQSKMLSLMQSVVSQAERSSKRSELFEEFILRQMQKEQAKDSSQ